VRTLRGAETRALELGIGNDTVLEVLRGLDPGDKVFLP